jgi:ribosomal protein S18 acetylase RimI-like enzyme
MTGQDSTTVTTARPADPAVLPLLDGLLYEYTSRYGEGAVREFDKHPNRLFTAEHGGALVLLVEDGQTVAGGALRAFDPELAVRGVLDPDFPDRPTTEFKRIWTHAEHRRRGLGRRVLDELERRAVELGYRQVFLTTGPSQPEAVALYLAAGYTELADLGAEGRGHPVHPFVKLLS